MVSFEIHKEKIMYGIQKDRTLVIHKSLRLEEIYGPWIYIDLANMRKVCKLTGECMGKSLLLENSELVQSHRVIVHVIYMEMCLKSSVTT